MPKNNDPAAATFGQIVAAKLAEKRWSQRRLAEAVQMGPTYINYLIRGKNPSARGGKFRPAPDVVQSIAEELGIPLEIAFTSAGIDPAITARYIGHQSEPPPTKRATSKPGDKDPGDAHSLYDIAHAAALAALERCSLSDPVTRQTATVQRKIDLPGTMHLVVEGNDIPDGQIALYAAAIRSACEKVKRKIEAESDKKL